jgi:branched-chain amino acid transport system ATP-binding protein
MSDELLRVENLSAGYGGAAVVRGIDLTVQRGEVVALLGANGAGKTTMLRVISGLLRPIEGSVRFDGVEATRLSPQALARRGMAHVPEGRGIFFGLTVAEHFRLGYRGEQLRLDDILDYFPALGEIRGRRAGLLSGGEQQMLAVARALARRPKLLLLDELSLGLAPIVVERLLPIVKQFVDDTGAGALLVEQHVHLALEVAGRGIVMSNGGITLEGWAEALMHDRYLLESSYLGDVAPRVAN